MHLFFMIHTHKIRCKPSPNKLHTQTKIGLQSISTSTWCNLGTVRQAYRLREMANTTTASYEDPLHVTSKHLNFEDPNEFQSPENYNLFDLYSKSSCFPKCCKGSIYIIRLPNRKLPELGSACPLFFHFIHLVVFSSSGTQ